MPDTLDKLDAFELRRECKRRGIRFPEGSPLALATSREMRAALRSDCYAEALYRGLLSTEE